MLKSPAWWSIALGLLGAIFTFTITRSTVEASTDARVTTLEVQVPAMEQRLSQQMEQNRKETRDDIRDMRREILEILKGK